MKFHHKYLFTIAGTLTILACIGQLFSLKFSPFLFSIGATLIILNQGSIIFNHPTTEKQQLRLNRMAFLSTLLLIPAAYYMYTGSNNWVVMVLIYSLNTLFLSYRFK